MDLGFSDEQVMLRDMVRKLCEECAPLSTLRKLEGTEPGFSSDFWQKLGELGLTGIAIAENYGGLALGALDGALVAEEFGRSLAVSPYCVSSVLAAELIACTGADAQKDHWLSAIASGQQFVSVASAESGATQDKAGIQLDVTLDGAHITLTGSKRFVPFAASADAIIVLARSQHGGVLGVLVTRDQLHAGDQVRMTYQINHAQDPLYKLDFNGLRIPAEQLLYAGECLWSHWLGAMSTALISLAAYAVGAAERIHEISVDYAQYRKAFGRPIGGFQAIAHYLAETIVAIDGARTLVHQAAWLRDQGRDYQQVAMMAKLQACETFRKAAAVAIQVHGGIGYTTEADPQLFFRRAKQLQAMHWDPPTLEQMIADQLFAAKRAG